MEMSREEKDIARRWCVLNCWGWPDDLVMPPTNAERYAWARELMAKCERQIGKRRILEYWNSGEFDGTTVTRRYDSVADTGRRGA